MADEDLQDQIDRLEQKIRAIQDREDRIAGNAVSVIEHLLRLHNSDDPIGRIDERTFRAALHEVKSDFGKIGH
jgi:hypothetical protein